MCNHFLVPKDGTPLGGLIQDHVVGAVKLTIRGRFFSEEDYHELVYFALGGYSKKIVLEPPCMFKPMLLWSGKQVVSTVVKNLIPSNKLPLTFTSMAKIKSKVRFFGRFCRRFCPCIQSQLRFKFDLS